VEFADYSTMQHLFLRGIAYSTGALSDSKAYFIGNIL